MLGANKKLSLVASLLVAAYSWQTFAAEEKLPGAEQAAVSVLEPLSPAVTPQADEIVYPILPVTFDGSFLDLAADSSPAQDETSEGEECPQPPSPPDLSGMEKALMHEIKLLLQEKFGDFNAELQKQLDAFRAELKADKDERVTTEKFAAKVLTLVAETTKSVAQDRKSVV